MVETHVPIIGTAVGLRGAQRLVIVQVVRQNKGDFCCELSHIFEPWQLWDSKLPSLQEDPGWLHYEPCSLTHNSFTKETMLPAALLRWPQNEGARQSGCTSTWTGLPNLGRGLVPG